MFMLLAAWQAVDVDTTQVIQPEQMQKGFLTVVAAVDDLQIDVPDAPDLVANFVARAVVDDILPPAFVDKLPPGMAMRHHVPYLWWACTAGTPGKMALCAASRITWSADLADRV